mmetsp:Transcript_28839/g.25519  ORF Transcript_28839/g.25519 Transcript_28839/m.25519 type:complete len:179 (+) Transcript_28839:63-599(+)
MKVDFAQPKEEYFKNFKITREIEKSEWRDHGVLIASDKETGFAPGSSINACRYKITDNVETQLPFEISIFTTKAAGGKSKVSLELEYTESDTAIPSVFKDVNVLIKVSDEPKLIKIENSTSNLDQKTSMITWITESLDETNSSALLEFYTTTDESYLFPLIVSFDYKGSQKSIFEIYD